ncbi:MAG: hypothetical protein BGP16_01610 [Sphingobium sp. 66-54]|nr:MAG: hypothetical protein BGP16_01610 [Sphingobium sp. 66-54]
MFKRPYLLVALTVLIAAPLIVTLLSRAIPSASDTAAAEATLPAETETAPSPPLAPLPVPATTDMTQPMDGSVNAAIEAAPSLDPLGIEPSVNGETESIATQLAGSEREEADGDRDE